MVERRNPRRRTTNGVGFAASRYGGWLAVDEEERQWVRADASRWMQCRLLASSGTLELVERVHFRLLRPPLEPRLGNAR
jgi:hypothetical protein